MDTGGTSYNVSLLGVHVSGYSSGIFTNHVQTSCQKSALLFCKVRQCEVMHDISRNH